MDCIFCKVLSGEAPGSVLYRDEQVTVIRDAHPIAKTHLLIIPNRHLESLNDLETGDEGLAGHMLLVAKEMAVREGVAKSGYRLIVNTGEDGGQSVYHLHLHLIAGRRARFTLG
jgi:histidine triad (HIT) family protein